MKVSTAWARRTSPRSASSAEPRCPAHTARISTHPAPTTGGNVSTARIARKIVVRRMVDLGRDAHDAYLLADSQPAIARESGRGPESSGANRADRSDTERP